MDDAYATAKWANRMLRPLTSLHHRLGKYRELQSIDATQQWQDKVDYRKATTSHTSTKNLPRDGGGDPESDRGDNDPSWIPGESDNKRRVKHKYVARGERLGRKARTRPVLRSPEAVKTLPGAIEIATPLITGKSTYAADQYNGETGMEYQHREYTSDADFQPARGRPSTERTGKGTRQSRFPRQDSQWRASLDSAKDANYVDIVQRLDVLFLKFLEKTGLPDSRYPRPIGGSRSLLLTVMRRLPEFIAEEQKLQDELDDEDDVDMADAYFTELESAYGSTTKGWQPLREAVRSQGIFLVYNMVQKNWITSYTASTLINKCIEAGENDAVESLLTAQLNKLGHYNYPDSFDPWRSAGSVRDPIRLLHKYWTSSKNNPYVFGQLQQLLHRRVLPTEWMVTMPWKACVVSATKSVSVGDREYAAATKFIEAVLKSAAGVSWTSGLQETTKNPQLSSTDLANARSISTFKLDAIGIDQGRCPVYIHDALSNLVSSLIVALCGMCFVRMEQVTNPDGDFHARVANMLTGLAISTKLELSVGRSGDKDKAAETQSLRRGYIFLGYCLLRCRRDPQLLEHDGTEVILKNDCEPFFALLNDNSEIIKEISVMVGQVVRCCERGEQAQCRQARKLCTQLLRFEQFGMDKLILFLGKVAVEVALDFAQYSQDAEDHAYAADIQDKVRAIRQRLNSGGKKRRPEDNHMPSFRWEEGISEWVAKTPLVRSKGSVSRILPQPMVEIIRGSSPCSGSEVSDSVSPGSTSSIASTATSLSLKRTRVDDEEYCYNIKRPRINYKNTRQSARIAIQRTAVSMVDNSEGDNAMYDAEGLSRSESDNDNEFSDQAGDRRRSYGKPRTQTDMVSNDADIRDGRTRHQVAQRGRDFEIVIYNNYSTTPVVAPLPALKHRGPGRPRKQASQRAPTQARVGQKPLARRSLIIPCSDGEESDDELSFLS